MPAVRTTLAVSSHRGQHACMQAHRIEFLSFPTPHNAAYAASSPVAGAMPWVAAFLAAPSEAQGARAAGDKRKIVQASGGGDGMRVYADTTASPHLTIGCPGAVDGRC